VRVLSHEINNSLAPIKSLSGSMRALLDRRPRAPDVDDDLRKGLEVISGRSEALVRFMSAYARLARLPAPHRRPVDVGSWVRRVAALETRLPVAVVAGPTLTLHADGDQLDQMLINVVRNAVDASLSTGGSVRVRWDQRNGSAIVLVEDEGPGLPESANLFVPFFTTKPEGSGIGLVLSRQITEAHGGTLALENRLDGAGCVAAITLPLPD
jgi:two-component system nitrogen regulation sensor histidine kinase NtrY